MKDMKRVSIVVFGDFLSFWVSFFFILFIRFDHSLFSSEVLRHLPPFAILYLVWTLIFFLFGLYDLSTIKPTIPSLKRFGFALLGSFTLGIFLFYLVPAFGITPKTNLLLQIIGFGIFSFLFRRIFYIVFSSQITRPTILVGKTKHLDELHSEIKTNPQLGLKIISYTNDLRKSFKEYTNLKNSVFIFEKNSSDIPEKDILNLIKNKTEIIDVVEAYERYLFKIPTDYVSQTWIIENINTNSNMLYASITRISDILFSLIIFCISFPFILISSVFIYLNDKGPIFYTQERVGLNGKTFKLYKLRSMVIDSEKNGAIWTAENDGRITPIGKVIRKLHIDELPQMLNILKGDLAFIGPRPEWLEFVKIFEESIPHYRLRHIIRPGFTGWAQIKYQYARNVKDSKEKFEYDLYYIKNRNIFLDFGIILKTIQIIFTH